MPAWILLIVVYVIGGLTFPMLMGLFGKRAAG